MTAKKLRSHCPINFYLEAFGDKWSLLILRDLIFRGKCTYGEFLKSEEGFATNILQTRLAHLEQEGIVKRTADPEDARRIRYRLTEKGLDLVPILFQMMVWSDKHDAKSETRRAPHLMDLIRHNQREISETTKERLRQGRPLFPDYLGGGKS